jgi:heavy metal response regulator
MRVLVVEDEDKIARFIKRGLKEEGYAVDVAKDGEEGHFQAATNDYDIVVLDVLLPKMDGFSLCSRLRKENITTPIIMLTARDEVRDKVKGFDCGADDYLTKPFAFEELLARMRANLRKKSSSVRSLYKVADLSLDVLKHEVRRAGKEISLTAREYTFLEYLMQHSGQIVTRTMIAEHVWDVHFDTCTNVIDVYIKYLRDKIDDGHSLKLIHTLRGRGYMLKA